MNNFLQFWRTMYKFIFICTEGDTFIYFLIFGLSLIFFIGTIYFLVRSCGERKKIWHAIRELIRRPILLDPTVFSTVGSKSSINVIPLLYTGFHLMFLLFILRCILYTTPSFIRTYILLEAHGLPWYTMFVLMIFIGS